MHLKPCLLILCGSLLAAALAGCDPGDRAASSSSAPPGNVTIITNAPAPTNAPAVNAPNAANAPAVNAPATNAPVAAANAPASGAADASSKSNGKTIGVTMETSKGTIDLELYPDKAPVTVQNFLSYVKKGFYNGTIFHRVIPTFMIQGGGFTPDMKEKPTDAPIKNEAGNGLVNNRGTVAMARTSNPDSATAQFFINVTDNDFLNHRDNSPSGMGYAVFGKVTHGMEVVDKIKDVATGTKPGPHGQPFDDVPMDPVIIKSVKLK